MSETLSDALVISMDFADSGSHADVSAMCKPPQAMLRLMVHAAADGHE